MILKILLQFTMSCLFAFVVGLVLWFTRELLTYIYILVTMSSI